jgi:glycosyltransferase involved in cell wall biosynthesis
MRVLHVVPSYIPAWRYGGPIRSVHGLCAGLARCGLEVHVFTTNVDGDRDSDVPLGEPVDLDGVRVTYFPSRRLRRLYYSPPMAAAFRRLSRGFDLVHLHSVFLWPTWAAARRARREGIPYLVSPKGMLVADLIRRKSRWLKTVWIALIERRTLERAAAIQVTSRQELEEYERFGFGGARPFLVPHGIDPPPRSRVVTGPPPPAPGSLARVVFLGRVNWEKGLDRLVPAMRHVPGAELVVAGNDEEGYTAKLADLARREGVDDRVVFRGPVQAEEKTELLLGASLVVLPSYSENFGMAVLEAMALGRPVVVTPEVGLAEAVAQTDSGIVVDGAPDELGPAIRKLLGDPEQLRAKGENGRRSVEERFTWDSVAQQMHAKYDEILRQR